MSEIRKPLTKEQIEELADSIYQLFKENDMWMDTSIFFNECRLNDEKRESDVDPRDYFEYVNPEHILSMSFEGPVYDMFNYCEYESVHEKFDALLKKYGLYYELGNAWNLSCYYL